MLQVDFCNVFLANISILGEIHFLQIILLTTMFARSYVAVMRVYTTGDVHKVTVQTRKLFAAAFISVGTFPGSAI